jgi:citrate synthase
MPNYYSAREAAEQLGVSRQTLYSYVSRGILRAHSANTARERRYLAVEVLSLARKRARSRRPSDIAKDTLNWGLPVVESSICLIADGRLFYRGRDALSLAETQSLEEVAALLWECPPVVTRQPQLPIDFLKMASRYPDTDPGVHILPLFASTDPGAAAGDLVRTLASCMLRRPVGAAPLHEECAKAWSLSSRNSQLVRRALILCADHELNASSFTVRCIAATEATLHAAILGGLAALSGARHGGATNRVETLWNEIERAGRPESLLQARLERDGGLPGFGHPLYPEGDVRAHALLSRIPARHANKWRAIADSVERLTGLKPSIDFALVALRRSLRLPEGSAFGLFALGRSLGWVAHALEQRQRGELIRPRANYIGPPPMCFAARMRR